MFRTVLRRLCRVKAMATSIDLLHPLSHLRIRYVQHIMFLDCRYSSRRTVHGASCYTLVYSGGRLSSLEQLAMVFHCFHRKYTSCSFFQIPTYTRCRLFPRGSRLARSEIQQYVHLYSVQILSAHYTRGPAIQTVTLFQTRC